MNKCLNILSISHLINDKIEIKDNILNIIVISLMIVFKIK